MEPSELELAEAELELAEAVEVPAVETKYEPVTGPRQGITSFQYSDVSPEIDPSRAREILSAGVPSTQTGISRVTTPQPAPTYGTAPDVVRAFGQKATFGIAPAMMDLVSGTGNQYKEEYRKQAENLPYASFIGSMTNPVGRMGSGGFLKNIGSQGLIGAAGTAIEEGLADQSVMSDESDIGKVATSAGVGALGGVAAGIPNLFRQAMAKLTPSALKFINDMSESVALQGGGLDPASVQAFREPGSSQMGLNTKMDDIKFALLNELQPGMMDSPQTLTNRLATNVSEAGEQYGKALDPIRDIEIPASEMQSRVGAIKDLFGGSTVTDPRIPSGPDARKIVQNLEDRFITPRAVQDQPSQFGPNDNMYGGSSNPEFVERNLPMSVIDEMKKAAQEEMYDPTAYKALGVVNPTKAGTTTVSGLDQMLRSEMTPAQQRAFDVANAQVGRSKGLEQAMAPGLNQRIGARPGSETMSDGLGRLVSTPIREGIARSRVGLLGATQAVANRGLNIIRSYKTPGRVPSNQMAPFAIDDVERKLAAISNMPPEEANKYVYVESLVNPAFRQVWLEAQKEEE